MLCPLCNQRKAKRACPALGRQICAVCCGTKRLVEISCPADCAYLSSARHHPPAIVQRQQEMDRAMLLPLLQGLSERQARLFLLLASVTSKHQAEALQNLTDADIADAAGAFASTLETAGRGIVYEHRPASVVATRLMNEYKAIVDDVVKNAGSALERDAAIALRRIEEAAKAMSAHMSRADAMPAESPDAGPPRSELQQLFARVLAPPAGPEARETPAAPPASIIIP
jgi:hypothetical protein